MKSTDILRTLPWPLILGLGALALIRPAGRIVEVQAGLDLSPALPIAVTIGVTVVWIATVGYRRVQQPLLTLACTGVVYGILSIVFSAVLSPILDGQLKGPLANPVAIVPVLLVNAIWGSIAGAIALMIHRSRSLDSPRTRG